MIHDLAAIQCLLDGGLRFRLRFGHGIGGCRGRRIHLTLSRAANPVGLPDYTRGLFDAIKQLEDAGNTVFPSHAEALWRENKAYMYENSGSWGYLIPKPASCAGASRYRRPPSR
jgi:hypothetical protein